MGRGLLKTMLGHWSLERKCLLFLGLALLCSLLIAFYAVQAVAERLVMETTRQSARDYANAVVGWEHISFYQLQSQNNGTPRQPMPPNKTNPLGEIGPSVLDNLRSYMLQARFEYKIMRIDDGLEHETLHNPIAEGGDLTRMVKIHARLAENDSILEEARKAITTPTPTEPNASAENSPAKTQPTNKQEPTLASAIAAPSKYFFEEAGPIDGFYYYYHPIAFERACMECHPKLVDKSSNLKTSPSTDPFRVIRVKMPYNEARVWTIWSYSVLTSIAICTLALSLFFVHWILKRLVIRPLSYLKHVSEEITRGETNLRFELDTDDEFYELSESFNRMLRHLTETQDQLRTVNNELDLRVDDLARVNLQLFEANRLKGEFLANMSHELRTPLNSILGFSEVLQGFESLTDKQRRYASNIQNSGRLLLEMINDILDLAKVEAGKMEVRPSDFCMLSVIQAQSEIVRKMAEDKNIDLRIDSSQSEMRIFQDQGKVQQILTNLLSNAIKFTPEGGLITIACEWGMENEIVFSVADTGVGVAPGDLEIIFEKFRQAKGVTGADGLTREHSGTGLGLSIVRELCRLLGGDITVTSQLGCGSTFRVSLPRSYQAKSEVVATGPIGEA